MSKGTVDVFFYGLFMDKALLGSKSIRPSRETTGYVDGYGLRIGRRATLVRESGHRTYGVLMTIGRDEATSLYADATVADYVAEPVSVTLPNGIVEPAVCYNLPPNALEGSNAVYAQRLLVLATKLGFPEDYLDRIRAQGHTT